MFAQYSHSKMWSVYDGSLLDSCVHKGNSLHSHTNAVSYTPLSLTHPRLTYTLIGSANVI